MAQAQGTVEKIVQKPTRTGGTAYSFVIDGNWYGYGFDAPKFGEGDTISFDYQQNGNFKNVNAKSVKKVESEPAPATQGGGSTAPSRNYGSNQVAIQYQASRNAAIEAVSMALQADALPLPAKKGEKYDAILALINDLTVQYHVDTDKVVTDGGVYPEELEQRLADPREDF